ncbi:hypothetical protein [Porphyrobacter sp. GA68]|uniref:hypothetical protein n=1 Tax=Porphyrobacter sp. GA68 TaxID=2883480 RepID=UPI001D191F46|nr:hypothetical protein [Porphyrobacter sp. GA68]
MPDHKPQSRSTNPDAAVRELIAAATAARTDLAQQLAFAIGWSDRGLFNDELIARSRGLLLHLAQQLAGAELGQNASEAPANSIDAILAALMTEPRLLAYCHALCLEYQLTTRLAREADLDPLLPRLLQEMIASADAITSRTAASCLSAQMRHLGAMERMRLPLEQLPADLLRIALAIGRTASARTDVADAVEQEVRTSYQEEGTRYALFKLLVNRPEYPDKRGWQLEKAGTGLFLAAFAERAELEWVDAAALLPAGQQARFALEALSSGCTRKALSRNLILLHNQAAIPVLSVLAFAGPAQLLAALEVATGEGTGL